MENDQKYIHLNSLQLTGIKDQHDILIRNTQPRRAHALLHASDPETESKHQRYHFEKRNQRKKFAQ